MLLVSPLEQRVQDNGVLAHALQTIEDLLLYLLCHDTNLVRDLEDSPGYVTGCQDTVISQPLLVPMLQRFY